MRKRHDRKPNLKLGNWRIEGNKYTINNGDLKEAIKVSGLSDDEIHKRMGVGYFHLTEALNGTPIDICAAAHIEWGLTYDVPT